MWFALVFARYDTHGVTVTHARETLHVMDDARRIALVETTTIDAGLTLLTPEPVVRFQLANHLGSASLELDLLAQVISYEEYHPHGSTSYQGGRSAAEVSLKRYRYSAMERDEESGLNYQTARYYAPWLGRWLSGDPKGLADGLNLYAYARANPIRFVDTTGLEARSLPEEVSDVVEAIHRRYQAHVSNLRGTGVTNPQDLGNAAGQLMEADIRGLFGRGAAEFVYDSQLPGGKTRVDITFRMEMLEVELKLSVDALRDKQDSALRDTAEKRGRTLAYVTEDGYEIYEPEPLKRSPSNGADWQRKAAALSGSEWASR